MYMVLGGWLVGKKMVVLRTNGLLVAHVYAGSGSNVSVRTEQDCIDALREAAGELGESPTKAAYEQLGLTPASATIIRTVGAGTRRKSEPVCANCHRKLHAADWE